MKKLLTFLLTALLAFGVGWAETVTLDFTSNTWGLPTSNTTTETTYTNGSYSIIIKGTGTGYRFESNGSYLILGKSGAYLTLPAFSKDTEKIVITGRSGASGKVTQNIYVGETAVSTSTTGATGTNTYQINSNYQAAGTVYTLKVTNANNTQITKIEVYLKESSSPTPTCDTPTFSPAGGTYTEAQNVTISCATSGATIYYTTDGTTPTTNSDVYSSAIPVSVTTTIKAIAVASGYNNSEVATATYTINSGGGTSSSTVYRRVTSTNDLVDGKKYILVYEGGPYAMGPIVSKKGSKIDGLTFNANSMIDIASKPSVVVFTLENASGGYKLKFPDNNYLGGSSSDLTSNTTGTIWTMILNGGGYYPVNDNRGVIFGISQEVFGHYATSNLTNNNSANYSPAYLYVQENSNAPMMQAPESLSIEDATGDATGTLAVTAQNLTDGISVSKTSDYWNVSPNSLGTDGGNVTVEYSGRALHATDTITLTTATANVNDVIVPVDYTYTGDIYIVVKTPGNPWNFESGDQIIQMTPQTNGTYKTELTVPDYGGHNGAGDDEAEGTHEFLQLTQKVGSGITWGSKYFFGPVAGNNWWLTEGTMNTIAYFEEANSHVIQMMPGDWTITINPANNSIIISPTIADPVITLASGRYYDAQTTTITCSTELAHIYYTTDGSDPSLTNGTLYDGNPIAINADMTLKAVAVLGSSNPTYSNVVTANYTIRALDGTDYQLANTVTVNDEYVLVYSSGTTDYAMGAFNSSNYYNTTTSSEDFELNGTIVTRKSNNVTILTIESAGENQYYISDENGYLYYNSGNTVNRGQLDTENDAYKWTINIDNDGIVTIQNVGDNERFLRCVTGNSPRFACYQSSSSNAHNAKLYKRAITVPRLRVSETAIDLGTIEAGGTSVSKTFKVRGFNLTEGVTLSVNPDETPGFNISPTTITAANLNNGYVTVTVTYVGTEATASNTVTITSNNNEVTAQTVTVTAAREPMTLTITPGDGYTFSGRTQTGIIESNVAGATIEYSFDGTTWQNYNANDGFTATVNTVGGTVTIYARATASNGQTATAQATYTRVPIATTCTATLIFDPSSDNQGIGNNDPLTWLRSHSVEDPEYFVSVASVSTLYTSSAYDAMRFGSNSNVGELELTLDLTRFETGACKLTKVTINAARYSNDTECQLNVATENESKTLYITASQSSFADYVFNFDGSEISTLTIANMASGKRVYVHSITLEYNCGAAIEAPVITPETGTYYESQTVEMSCDTEGATIHYTMDGTTPTASSPVYEGEFTAPYDGINGSTTIQAIAVLTDGGESLTSQPTEVTYTWATPVVNIRPATRDVYNPAVTVVIGCNPIDANVYYTTDGSEPNASNGTLYEGPFEVTFDNLNESVTVKAIAYNHSGAGSAVDEATYTYKQKVIEVNAPFFSPLEGSAGGYSGNYYGDQTLEMATTTENADIYYKIEEVSGTTPPSSVSDPTKSTTDHYTGPITMEVGKSYRVKAIAYLGDFASTISEGYYTILPERTSSSVIYVKDCAEFNALTVTGSQYTVQFMNPVQVVYMSTYVNNGTMGEYCYVRDNSDYACIYLGKRNTNGERVFVMGDWIDGNQISGEPNIWDRNFHIQLQKPDTWPTNILGHTEILPEHTDCATIASGTTQGANLWGHYVHVPYTTMNNVEDNGLDSSNYYDYKHNGTISDNTGSDTYYDKFYLWSAGTQQYGSYWDPINIPSDHDYDQAFFTEKQEAGATFDVYGIVDYYKPYTQPFEVCPIDFQWIYKPVITPGTNLNCTSQQVVDITVITPEWDGATTPTIYYKTDDMEDWEEFIGPFVVNSDTHVQAYAQMPSRYDDMMRSVIVETEYKFIGIKDPEIDPASMVIEVITGNEKVEDIMISDSNDANSGAVTVYTTDGTMPSATNGTQIAAGDIVELDPITETTTVTAISYLPDGEGNPVLWSNPVTVTYTFVKSNGVVYDLVDAVTMDKVYVIVNKDAYMGLSTAQNGNNRGSTGVKFTDGTKEHVYGNDELALFVLESANAGRYYFKNINGNGYLTVTTNDVANLSTSATASSYSEAAVAIGSQAAGCPATITFNYDGTNRYLRYFAKGRTFTTNSDVTLNQDVFLYGTTATPLAVIESKITAGPNVQVTVADNLIGAWAINNPNGDPNGEKYLWAKDMGLSIDKTAPVAGQKDYVKNILHYQNHDWDQSNWVILDFSGLDEETDPEDFVGKRLNGGTITGKYVDDNNYRIVLDIAPQAIADADAGKKYPGYNEADVLEEDDPQSYGLGYNTYIPTNFYDAYMNAPYGEGFVAEQGYALGTHAGEKLFFMNPKVQEVARVWGIYTQKEGGQDVFTCITPSLENMVNGWGIKGAFAVKWDYNRVNQDMYGARPSGLGYTDVNKAFMFHAAIVAKSTSGRRANVVGTADDASNMSDRFVIYPLDFKSSEGNVVTGVEELNVLMKDVESVRYYNIMGMESEKPFEGINIVVTRYTDGSTSTAKILR